MCVPAGVCLGDSHGKDAVQANPEDSSLGLWVVGKAVMGGEMFGRQGRG